MRKVLFATTALATVAGTMAIANADVTVSGGVEWRYMSVSDDMDNETARASDSNFNSNTDVTISFTSTTDSGITMSASQNWDNGGAAETFTSITSDFGTIEVVEGSSTAHASSSYDVTSPTMSGGVGDMAHTVTTSSGGATGSLNANEALISDGGGTNQINYHSPVVGGFQFGAGVGHLEASDSDTSTSMGMKYAGTAGDVSYNVGYASFDGADSNSEGTHVGFNISWDGMTVGAGSSENTGSTGAEEETVSYAITYKMSDDLTVGAGMTDSENGTESLSNVQVGVVYTIAPGLTASLASHSFEYENTASTGDNNEGTVTQAELKMSF
jgi:hypothetical protein